ncbi:MAG: hypothetical protein H0T42_14610 [Deltaproteobacteria bacterium]|nr:hypothetical protein [Deltaproteobacteria bacterium]
MRGAVVAAVLTGALCASGSASAEELPPGSLGVIVGVIAGTGADAKPLGVGYLLGGQAAWQPMSTQSRLGWSVKSSVVFGTMYSSAAARIDDELLTLQMDVMLGIRFRPGDNPSRYLTARVGGALFRANQVIPPSMQRAFAGGVASVGLDQYISGWLFNADVRYGLIGQGPSELGLVLGVAKTGP